MHVMTPASTNDLATKRIRWSIVVFAFGIALILLAFALYILAAPHGLVIGPRDVSLAERLILPLIIAAFPCCAAAPFISRRHMKDKILLSVCGVAGAIAVIFAGVCGLRLMYGSCL